MEEIKTEIEETSELSTTDLTGAAPEEGNAGSSGEKSAGGESESPADNATADVRDEESHGDNRLVTIISRILTVLLLAGCTVLGVVGYRRGAFASVDALQEWMNSYGFWAPLMFIILQTVQVIIPIIPGGVTLLGTSRRMPSLLRSRGSRS